MAGGKGKKTPSASTASSSSANNDDDSDHASTSPQDIQSVLDLLSNFKKDHAKEMKDRDRREQTMANLIADLQNRLGNTGQAASSVNARGTGNSRRINIAGLEKMSGEITLRDFQSWRTKWNDFCQIEQLSTYSPAEQTAALRMALSNEMLQTVEMVLGIAPTTTNRSPTEILDLIRDHIRKKRSVALDRLEFEQCRQDANETFDSFFIRSQRIAACADICVPCSDQRMATRVMVAIKDQSTRKKLLAITPFPSLQAVVDICRSEESASKDESRLTQPPSAVNKVSSQCNNSRRNLSKSRGRGQPSDHGCKNCGRTAHRDGEKCPAKGKQCSHCGKDNNFAADCRQNPENSSNSSKPNPSGKSAGPEKKVRRVRLLRVAVSRRVPTVDIEVFDKRGKFLATITAVPDSGSEATVAGVGVLHLLDGDVENLRDRGKDNLVAANELSLESIGRQEHLLSYQGKSVSTTVVFSPEHKGMLLSWFVCIELGILPSNYPEPVTTFVNHLRINDPAVEPNPLTVNVNGPIDIAYIPDIKQQLLCEFADVFDSGGPLKTMDGPPMKIELLPNAVPFSVNGARPIPFAWRDEVKKMLENMESQGIIAHVSEPTDWTHPLVVTTKQDGSLRICVDLKRLNDYVKRPLHPLVTAKDAVSSITSGSKFFTSFDAKHGYWQLPLAEECQLLTTFITPWGRYNFFRGPMGLSSTGDEFCRRLESVLSGVPGVVRVIDDMLVHSDDLPSHVAKVCSILTLFRKHHITIGVPKFRFAVEEVKFAGYIVKTGGVVADPEKLEAIARFPRPVNITQLRSFFGMVNQLTDFSSDIASTARPLRTLLRDDTPYIWTVDHEAAFESVKRALISPPVLANYDPAAETMLQTDVSLKNGLGYALLQRHGDQWKLIQWGSRFVKDVESRYAVVELEMCAVQWAFKKCRLYLLGLPHFTLIVDHQPLVTILDHRTLDAVENPRLQRMKQRMAGFNFTTIWRKGKLHAIPDALSRAPVSDPEPEDFADEPDIVCHVRSLVAHAVATISGDEESPYHLSDPILVNLKTDAAADASYQALIGAVQKGFPSNPQQLDPFVRPFWNVRGDLWTDDGLVLLGKRIIVPIARRPEILTKLHSAHQGIERSKRRARQLVYWPGINSDITNTVRACVACQTSLPSLQREPILQDPPPSRVFEDVSADIFSHSGNHYIAHADRLSGWPTIKAFYGRDLNSRDVIQFLTNTFVDLGVPVRLRSDGGKQFDSAEVAAFLKRWGVQHVLSTPHYPQSNGHAEAAVKAIENLVIKSSVNGRIDNDDFMQALLEWRNTPKSQGMSPAEIVFGRPLRSILPSHQSIFHHSNFDSKWKAAMDKADAIAEKERKKSAARYNSYSKTIKPIPIGTSVRVQDHASKLWNKRGVIISVGKHRDYRIKMESGRVYWRNRRFVRIDFTKDDEHQTNELQQPADNPATPSTDPPDRSSRSTDKSSNAPGPPHVTFAEQPLRRSDRQRQRPARYRQ